MEPSKDAADEFERVTEFMRAYLLLRLYRLTLLLGSSGAVITALASDAVRQRGAIVILLLKVGAIAVSSAFMIMDFSAAGHWNRFLIRANELATQLNYARFPTPSRWEPIYRDRFGKLSACNDCAALGDQPVSSGRGVDQENSANHRPVGVRRLDRVSPHQGLATGAYCLG